MTEKTAKEKKLEAFDAACDGIIKTCGGAKVIGYGLKLAKYYAEKNPDYKGGIVHFHG